MKDARDHLFTPKLVHLPPSIDLRANYPPVMDQDELGSCTAHGITGAVSYEMIRRGQPDVTMARLQLYYDEHAIEGTIKSDAGAEIRDGIKCAAKIGVAHEALWPYQIKKFASEPKAAVYRDAVQFKALTYLRVEVGAAALKSALAAGHTPVIGLTLYDTALDADWIEARKRVFGATRTPVVVALWFRHASANRKKPPKRVGLLQAARSLSLRARQP